MRRAQLLTAGICSAAVLVAAPLAASTSASAGPTRTTATVTQRATPGTTHAARTFHGHRQTASTRTTTSTTHHPWVDRFVSPNGTYPAAKSTGAGAPRLAGAATAQATTTATNANSLIQNFHGLSDLTQAAVSGGEVTPPDQGLCVGNDPTLAGNPRVVFELINIAVRETDAKGNLVAPDTDLVTFFQDPGAEGDVRCFYDVNTSSFYFTEIGAMLAGPDSGQTSLDVAVLNKNGFSVYQVDTSLGGDCFGDQPKIGYDANAVYASTDEYCGPNLTAYKGAIVQVLSKPELVGQEAALDYVQFGPLSLPAGDPVLGIQPAVNTGSPRVTTEYMLNSFPYDQYGNNNPTSTSLGLWTVTGDAALAGGSGAVAISGKVITSEAYSFPVPAASTGNGSNHIVDGFPVVSETALNPDDSRMQQVQGLTTSSGLRLWGTVSTALQVNGDPSDRDGVAWFQVNPANGTVTSQGYVAQAGAYLLYPAILKPANAPASIVFTLTSSTTHPAAAFTTIGSGSIRIVGAGYGAHVSFADAPPFNSPRWGDYSAATFDVDRTHVWMATERIPPKSDWDPLDNWGTEIFEH